MKTIIEKIKNDKVYQFGLILFVSVIALKIIVDHSAKKHGVVGLGASVQVNAPVAATTTAAPAIAARPAAATTSAADTGYSVNTNRPARGTAAGIALMNRQATATATRAVASAAAGSRGWALAQSGRAQPRQEVWKQTSGYSALPKKGAVTVGVKAGSAVNSYHELKGAEVASLESEISSVRQPAKASALKVKRKIVRR